MSHGAAQRSGGQPEEEAVAGGLGSDAVRGDAENINPNKSMWRKRALVGSQRRKPSSVGSAATPCGVALKP